jgi:F0F1-type ATP synthase beta subunit
MYKHKGILEDHKKTNREEFERIAIEFYNYCKEVDQILKDYKVISELIRIAGNDRETIEKKLQRYNG